MRSPAEKILHLDVGGQIREGSLVISHEYFPLSAAFFFAKLRDALQIIQLDERGEQKGYPFLVSWDLFWRVCSRADRARENRFEASNAIVMKRRGML